MNAEQLLNKIEEAIKNRPVSPAKKYWLIYRQGKIMCLPVAPPGPDAVILETLHSIDLEEGLTLKGWSKISSRLAKIEKEKTT